MNAIDLIGLYALLVAGAVNISRAGFQEARDRGFPGAPWPARGAIVLVGLAMWLRAGMIYPDAYAVTFDHPTGRHVSESEAGMYVIIAGASLVLLFNYFFDAHRWYQGQKPLWVSYPDAPTIKSIPEQVADTIREVVPEALDQANKNLFSKLSAEKIPDYGLRRVK